MIRFVQTLFLTAILFSFSTVACSQSSEERPDNLPEDFSQILPRGQIPAIFDPQFVPAEEADIDGDSWVLGVVINGEARAYSLNLLNHHEVVNDQVDSTSFAAVW